MDKKTKQYLLIMILGIVLFVALINWSAVLGLAKEIISIILPIIAGSILALFISVPMNGIEKFLKNRLKNKKDNPSDRMIYIFSFMLTVLAVLLVFVFVLTLLIPEIIYSSKNMFAQLDANLPQWLAYLDSQQINMQWLKDLLSEIDAKKMMQSVSDGIDALLPNVASALSSTVNVVITAGFSLIISIYMTLGREKVCRHARKLVCAYLKPNWSKNALRFSRMFYQSFSKFLSGQCGEAVILGTLMFFAFTMFRLPYGSLVGVLTAVCAIIPYVGAFISCSVSILLTLLLDPTLAIKCAIVYLVVQFIENQFIYPRVVGESVGLPPLYTLIAAMLGGKIFGIIGILFFIPLTAVCIEVVKEDANKRLNKKKIEVTK